MRRGPPQTRLDHVYMACALNLLGLEAFWTGTPLDRQRASHVARLGLGLAARTRINHQDPPETQKNRLSIPSAHPASWE